MDAGGDMSETSQILSTSLLLADMRGVREDPNIDMLSCSLSAT
jgi:hypothetical protein